MPYIVLNKEQMKNKELVRAYRTGGFTIIRDHKVPKSFINWRKFRVWRRKHQYTILVFFISAIAGAILAYTIFAEPKTTELITPCPDYGCFATPTPTITPKIVPTTAPNAPKRPVTGKASYYSVAGCIGCSPSLTMANGQRLDDTRTTLAYNHAPLNTWVTVTNIATGQSVRALITDRGGFERHGKIADLSVATKNAIGCGDVCSIKIDL